LDWPTGFAQRVSASRQPDLRHGLTFLNSGKVRAEYNIFFNARDWDIGMKARDVMVSPVITVPPSASVKEVAEILVQHRISAVPVVDADNKIVGIVSEGDLMHRSEVGTERRHAWWLQGFTSPEALADEYVRAHSRKVADLMTTKVVTALPDTPLYEVAGLMERNQVKRVPIVKDGQLLGIVSRGNLVQAIASTGNKLEISLSDTTIREKLLTYIRQQDWAHPWQLNATVSGGVVDLWGIVTSDIERNAIRVAAESMPGVCAVNNHLVVARTAA
jgi:CBS domain-containing protein